MLSIYQTKIMCAKQKQVLSFQDAIRTLCDQFDIHVEFNINDPLCHFPDRQTIKLSHEFLSDRLITFNLSPRTQQLSLSYKFTKKLSANTPVLNSNVIEKALIDYYLSASYHEWASLLNSMLLTPVSKWDCKSEKTFMLAFNGVLTSLNPYRLRSTAPYRFKLANIIKYMQQIMLFDSIRQIDVTSYSNQLSVIDFTQIVRLPQNNVGLMHKTIDLYINIDKNGELPVVTMTNNANQIASTIQNDVQLTQLVTNVIIYMAQQTHSKGEL